MEFFKIAQKLEEEIKSYYSDLIHKCISNVGLKSILTMLIMEHEQHLTKLRKLQEETCDIKSIKIEYSKIADIFKTLQKKKETFSCDIDQLNMYREAREMIKRKIEFYQQALDNLNCEISEKQFTDIIADENRQIRVLDNIIEMVERPQSWIEDAEFNHLEEY